MNELSALEIRILTAARDDGLIHFPQGTARAVEETFRILTGLAQRGYAQRANKTGYRAYWLTDKSRRLDRIARSVQPEALTQAA